MRIMKLAIMQPYFFPYLGAFQNIYAVDRYLFYGNVNYKTNGWFNRNRLLQKGRGPIYFHVQLTNPHYRRTFKEIQVDPDQRWRDKLIKTIEQNYNKTPYYKDNIDLFVQIINQRCENLLKYNANSVIEVCHHLGLITDMRIVESEYDNLEESLRTGFSRSASDPDYLQEDVDIKTARILHICKNERAETYINPMGGKTLYDRDTFNRFGVQLMFINPGQIEYKQQWNMFAPNLSILDVLMNCGRQRTLEFLKYYDLT